MNVYEPIMKMCGPADESKQPSVYYLHNDTRLTSPVIDISDTTFTVSICVINRQFILGGVN